MKEKILPFREIEWWLMTVIIFLIVFTNTLGGKIGLHRLGNSSDPNLTAQYFAYIFIPLALYGAFYFLHVRILPAYKKEGRKAKMVWQALLAFFGSWLMVGFFYINARFGSDPFMPFFFISIVIYLAYHLSVRFLDHFSLFTKSTHTLAYNIIRCLFLYVFMMIFLSIISDYFHQAILIFYVAVIPLILILLLYNYFLIFRMKLRDKPKEAKGYTLFLPITVFVLFTVAGLASHTHELLIVGAVTSLFILAVINPLALMLFSKYHNVLLLLSIKKRSPKSNGIS